MKFIEGGADLQFTSNTFIFLFNTNFVALLLVEDIDSNFLVHSIPFIGSLPICGKWLDTR